MRHPETRNKLAMMLFYCLFAASLCPLLVCLAEVTVLRQVQVVYDLSPKLRIRGNGFDADENNIHIEISASGQSPLVANKDFMLIKDSDGDGLILKLLANRRWIDLTNRNPPVALVLNAVRFGVDPLNLLPEPIVIANVLPYPGVELSNAFVGQTVSSNLYINGTGLLGAKRTDFYFNPPIFKEITYEDVTVYPLRSNQVVLRLRHGYQWRESPGPLVVIGIDTGGEPVKINGDMGTLVAEVVSDLSPLLEPLPVPTPHPDPAFPASSVTVLKQNQVIYDRSPKLRIRGSGFDVVDAEHVLLNIGAAGQPSLVAGRDFTVVQDEAGDGIVLKLLTDRTWVDLSNLRPPVALVLREVKFGSETNVNVLQEPVIVAQVLSVPTVYENSTLALRQFDATLTITGTGFVGASKIDFFFNPPLVKDVHYTDMSQYPLTSDQIVLRLRGSYQWRSEPGPLFVIGADSGGGPVRFGMEGVLIAKVVNDNAIDPTDICWNTCIYHRDGVCDDPRGTNHCAAGTDCQDCGPSGAPVNNTNTGPSHPGDGDDWTFNDDYSANRTDGNPSIHHYTPHKESDDFPMFLILLIALPLLAVLGVAVARCTMLEAGKPNTGVAMSVRPSTATYTAVEGDCEGEEESVAASVVQENRVSYV